MAILQFKNLRILLQIFSLLLHYAQVVLVKGVNFQSMVRSYYKHEALLCIMSLGLGFLLLAYSIARITLDMFQSV